MHSPLLLNNINNFFIYGPWLVTLGVLAFFLFEVHLKQKVNRRHLMIGIAIVAGVLLILAITKTAFQYYVWKTGGPLTQAFLPPTNPISYFVQYALWRFWAPSLATLFASLVYGLTIYFVRRANPRLFFEGEELLAALAILVVGWPILIFYTVLLLGLLLAASLYSSLKKVQYTAFIFAWLPLALISILIGKKIIIAIGWGALFISGS